MWKLKTRFQESCVTLIPEIFHTLLPAQAAIRLSTDHVVDGFINFGIENYIEVWFSL